MAIIGNIPYFQTNSHLDFVGWLPRQFLLQLLQGLMAGHPKRLVLGISKKPSQPPCRRAAHSFSCRSAWGDHWFFHREFFFTSEWWPFLAELTHWHKKKFLGCVVSWGWWLVACSGSGLVPATFSSGKVWQKHGLETGQNSRVCKVRYRKI